MGRQRATIRAFRSIRRVEAFRHHPDSVRVMSAPPKAVDAATERRCTSARASQWARPKEDRMRGLKSQPASRQSAVYMRDLILRYSSRGSREGRLVAAEVCGDVTPMSIATRPAPPNGMAEVRISAGRRRSAWEEELEEPKETSVWVEGSETRARLARWSRS